MRSKWWYAALAGAATVIGTLATAQAQDVLKIGGVGPLSGGGTAWGLAAQRGIEIAIEEINAGRRLQGRRQNLQARAGHVR